MTGKPFQQSMETALLIAHLKKTVVGQTVSYEELTRVAGKPIVGGASELRTARIRLAKDNDMLFSCLPTKGVMRLDDRGIVNEGIARTGHVRRYTKNTAQRLAKIADFSALPRDYQLKHSSAISINATIAFMTRTKVMKRLEGDAPPTKKPLPIEQTLEFFRKK